MRRFTILAVITIFTGCTTITQQPVPQRATVEEKKVAPKEETFIGVMISREYDAKANVYKYVVKSPSSERRVEFTSINKILYKDDLIQLRIVDGVVDTKSIALLQKEYYKSLKNKKTALPKELLEKPLPEPKQKITEDTIHPQGYPKATDAEQL